MTYTMIGVGEGTGGGMMQQMTPGAPSSWLAYVLVDDIEAATAKAKSLGATIKKDVMEVTGAGWLSIITDPTGACLVFGSPKGSNPRHALSVGTESGAREQGNDRHSGVAVAPPRPGLLP